MPHTSGRGRLLFAFILTITICAPSVHGATMATSPASLTVDSLRVQAIAAMLPEHPAGLGRPITDRTAWSEMAGRMPFKTILNDAEKLRAAPLPVTSDDLYKEFSRTGNRTHWEKVNFDRRGRITTLVLAECLEAKGRFLPVLTDVIKSVCAERTWIMPAHDPGLANFEGKTIDIDLASSALAWTLATADWLLGARLAPDVRQLIRSQVRQRVLDPFKDMTTGRRPANHWITCTNNWNAVCLAGVTGAALTLVEPREERAYIVACAEKYSRSFLAGFAADGYCTEGVGYWNYGFGHYLMLAETILQATSGEVDLLAGERVKRAALYGMKIQIMPGVCPAFADCAVTASPADRYMGYIGRRWGLRLREHDDAPVSTGSWLFDVMLFAFANSATRTLPAPATWDGPGERTWFDQAGILIGRPGARSACRLAVAIKGGHNAEHHNHNDVGSYVVVVGRQLVLVDPGAEVYTARTFSERRYDSKVLNSFGHPVPMVAGKLQRPGANARARVVRTEFTDEADTLVLDIRSAHDVPALEKLERTFVYSRRGTGALTVTDDVVFKSPQAFGTALVTFGRWEKLTSDRLRIEGNGEVVDVVIRATGGDVVLHADEIREDLRTKHTPTRIGIDFAMPVAKGTIEMKITPAGR